MAYKRDVYNLVAFMIVSSLITWCNADVFSATFKVEKLLKTRQKIIEDLDAYIQKEEDRLRDLKQRINWYRVEQQHSLKDVASFVGHPINAYILIKRLTVDLDHIKKLSDNTGFMVQQNQTERDNEQVPILFPTSVDLEGAALGLRKLQRVYKLTVGNMANGVIDGTIYSLAMSASDCHHLGKLMMKRKDYLSSLDWQMEALKRFKSPDNKDDSITEIDILQSIGITYYHIGDTQSAIDWTLKILAIDPDNEEAESNIIVYEELDYRRRTSTNIPVQKEANKDTNDSDNIDNPETDKEIYDDNNDAYDEMNTVDHEAKNSSDSSTNNIDTNKNEFEIDEDDTSLKFKSNPNEKQNLPEKHIEISADNVNENTLGSEINVQNVTDAEYFTIENKKGTDVKPPTEEEIKKRETIDFRKDIAMYEALCRGEYNVAPEVASRLSCRYVHDAPFLTIAPIKAEQFYLDPVVILFHDVINDAEIKTVKQLCSGNFNRAEVATGATTSAVTDYRVSQICWLSDSDSPVVNRLSKKVGDFTGLDAESADDLQVANYGLAGRYEPHFDWRKAVSSNFTRSSWDRISTVMFYLSDVAQGGATVFPKLGLSVFPKKGSAIFWNNLLSSGEVDYATRHAACPVLEGSKWVANKWIYLEGQEWIKPCGLKYESERDPRHVPEPVPKPSVVDPTIVRTRK